MKVLFINVVCGIRSTGRICTDLAQKLESEGHEVKIACRNNEYIPEQYQKYAVKIGTKFDVKMHGLKTRLLDEHGFASKKATKEFLAWAEQYSPDLLWLHNIHGYYINVEMLFNWIKTRPHMEVKWTLHDCWAFTGHCSYFTYVNCNKWKEQCENCVQKDSYPASMLKDNCKVNFNRKKAAFTGVNHMTLITPSQWLADLVKQSYLKEYPVEVNYNQIDKNIFRPTESNFREVHGLQNNVIILGVASTWDKRKGLQDFFELRKLLPEKYTIVLVGLNSKQLEQLPEGIVGIARTDNVKELAGLYTTADWFVNPTYEDNYPTVNLEAEACGTRVITYDTGGCSETIQKKDSVVLTSKSAKAIREHIMKDEHSV